MYHYTDGGLRNVWLANGYEIKQTPYGEGVSFHNLDGLTQSICMALTHKASFLRGAELRYIRSAGMLLSQPALGKLMGMDGVETAKVAVTPVQRSDEHAHHDLSCCSESIWDAH
jgi:hypothetical protein